MLGKEIAQRRGTDHSPVMASLIVEVPAYTRRDSSRSQTAPIEGLEKRSGHIDICVITLQQTLSVEWSRHSP